MFFSASSARRVGDGRGSWFWPVILGLSSAGAWAAAVAPALAPVRPFVIGWFLLVCPGVALVRLIRLQTAVAVWTLSVALSVATEAIVASGLLYAGAWSAARGLVLLIGVTMLATVVRTLGDRGAIGRPGPVEVGPSDH